MDAEDRFVALETRAAEAERLAEELSGEVAAQWKEIERLRKTVEALAERFRSLEDAVPAPEAAKPPHW